MGRPRKEAICCQPFSDVGCGSNFAIGFYSVSKSSLMQQKPFASISRPLLNRLASAGAMELQRSLSCLSRSIESPMIPSIHEPVLAFLLCQSPPHRRHPVIWVNRFLGIPQPLSLISK